MTISGRKRLGLSVALAAGALWSAAALAGKQEAANTKIALAFTKAMEEHNVPQASSYLADGYIQHNPNVPTGKAGYVKFFNTLWKDGPKPAEATLDNPPVVTAAEGDRVVLVFRKPQPDPTAPGQTYDQFSFDAYRLENGKIVEHWDGYPKRAPASAPASTAAPAPTSSGNK